VQSLLAQANTDFQNANNALMASPPNLGAYQSDVAAAEAAVAQAQALEPKGATPTTVAGG